MKDELRREVMRSIEDVAELLKGMSRDEVVAYYRNFYKMVMEDPEMMAALPPEQLKDVMDKIDTMEKAFENEKIAKRNEEIAEQESALARARFNRVADDLLCTPSRRRDN